jgi:putative transcriptional regulator
VAANIAHGQMPPIDVRHAAAQTSWAILSNQQHAAHGPGTSVWHGSGSGIVNQTLTHVADYLEARSATVIPALGPERILKIRWNMRRLRLKADGRIVELRDGREFPLAPAMPLAAPATISAPGTMPVAPGQAATAPAVRDLRRRARLTQLEFASRLGVPVETIRNWEQGKRLPRGPARALLAVIAHAPETVFSALAKT